MSGYLQMSVPKKTKLAIPGFSGGVNLFADESVMDVSRAKQCFNFRFEDGALKTGYGLSAFDGFDGLSVRSLFKYVKATAVGDEVILIAVTNDGYVYAKRDGSAPERLYSTALSLPVTVVNYRLYGEDVALICSPGGMLVYGGSGIPGSVANAPDITSLTLHNERLFVTTGGESNSVWFSDDLDPTNWDTSLSSGGFIQLIDERGASRKVLSYGGYVYVFRDRGITRISAYGAQTEFSVSNLFVGSGRIYPDTVTLCGDVVLMLCDDGLYSFDGITTRKLLTNLDGLFCGGAPCGFYSGGKYFLSFKTDVGDDIVGCESGEYVNNALLVVDINNGSYYIGRGMDVVGFAEPDDTVVILSDGRVAKLDSSGAVFGTPLLKKWRVPKTDLNDVKVKCVRELHVTTEYPLTVKLIGDESEKSIAVSGGPAPKCVRTNFSSKRVGLELISSTAAAHVTKPYLIITKRNGR